jgi:hypothetical protein
MKSTNYLYPYFAAEPRKITNSKNFPRLKNKYFVVNFPWLHTKSFCGPTHPSPVANAAQTGVASSKTLQTFVGHIPWFRKKHFWFVKKNSWSSAVQRNGGIE